MGGIAQNASENVTLVLRIGNQPSHGKQRGPRPFPVLTEEGGLPAGASEIWNKMNPHDCDPDTVCLSPDLLSFLKLTKTYAKRAFGKPAFSYK